MKCILLSSLIALLPGVSWSQQVPDAIQALEQRKKALHIQQTTELGRYLKEQQVQYMKSGDLDSSNALQALLDEATKRYTALQNDTASPSNQADAAVQFVEQLNGNAWDLATLNKPHFTVHVEGGNIVWKDDSGKDQYILKYTVLWTGLLKVDYNSGKMAYYAFSQDLSKLWILTATSEFPGALLQKP